MGKKTSIAILSMLPVVLSIVAIPFVNRIQPIIFGLPFFAFWLFLAMVLSSLITFAIYRLQHSDGSAEE